MGATAVILTWDTPKCGANLVRHLTMAKFPDLFVIGAYKPDLRLTNACTATHTHTVKLCSGALVRYSHTMVRYRYTSSKPLPVYND